MNKIWLVIQREYFTRVKKKSFLLTTILVPLVIVAFYAAIIAIQISDNSETAKIAIIDDANLLVDNVEKKGNIEYVFIARENEESFKKKYKQQGYKYFLYIPQTDINHPEGINIHSESSVSIYTKLEIEKIINKAFEAKRLKAANIKVDQYKLIDAEVNINNSLDSGKEGVTAAASIISAVCGILIYMILMIYGTMVMRGVMEEKISRIAEVIISSVKPFQLMMGKIIGIGFVGITQFTIWLILILILQMLLPIFFPSMVEQATQVAASSQSGATSAALMFTKSIGSLPIGTIIFFFIFYFIGGYLMYSSLFAAIGSVISEDQQEAQQLLLPVMMPIILGFIIMTKAITDPNSGLVVFGSIFPLTSPIVMMARICFDVPIWQLIASMLLLILSFIFLTWLTAKIYRTGILLYGKKITWKEMIKWMMKRS